MLAAIERLSPGGGTSLGQGLFTSLSAIAGKPLHDRRATLERDGGEIDIGFFGSSAIVLLSDGENTSEPDPLHDRRARVVGRGRASTRSGSARPKGRCVEVDGFSVATALDEELLTEIAEVTDGTYQRRGATPRRSTGIYESIDLESSASSEPREVTALFAAGGGLLLALGSLLSLAWFGRVI